MARTKRAVSAKPVVEKSTNHAQVKNIVLKKLEEEEKRIMELLDKRMEEELKQLHINSAALKTKFPTPMINRTMWEIKNGELDDTQLSGTTMMNSTNIHSTFNSTTINNTTKSVKKTRQSTRSSSSTTHVINKTKAPSRSQRSISVGCDDEGYTTAESTRGTSGSDHHASTRMSRSKTRSAQPKPMSRSLSRHTTKSSSSMKTPAKKQLSTINNSGTITPKCKPNTPLMYVRRPKVGEQAWSNQGSPLLISGTVTAERTANVNIPIGGDILSMLPTRGAIRESLIPDVDDDTRRQLEILRDNLIKVCHTIRK